MRSLLLLLSLTTSACTTPLYYAVGPTDDQASGAWTQTAGTSPAAGWSSDASAWPEGPPPDLYRAHSLEDLAWGSELQPQSAKGTLRDGQPTLPGQDEYAAQAYGRMPNAPLVNGNGARPVAPGSTGTGSFGAKDPLALQRTDGPTALRAGADSGALVAEPPGSTTDLGMPTREVQADGSGRPFLFELFQEARDERDVLRVENDELLALVEDIQGQLNTLRESTAGANSELERTKTERDALRDEIESLQEEKDELEGRLLTAQIRRLEAEKGLIEQWIQGELDAASAGLSAAVNSLNPSEAGAP